MILLLFLISVGACYTKLFIVEIIGGHDIQVECNDYVKTNGKLLPGKVYASRPGNLPCKMIIHAVGPRWTGGGSEEADHLFSAVFEALKIAGINRMQSIAMPAISTGIYNYPLRAACQVMLNAIVEYYQKGNQLPTEVHLVTNDALTTQAFHEAVLQTFGGERSQQVSVVPLKLTKEPSSYTREF